MISRERSRNKTRDSSKDKKQKANKSRDNKLKDNKTKDNRAKDNKTKDSKSKDHRSKSKKSKESKQSKKDNKKISEHSEIRSLLMKIKKNKKSNSDITLAIAECFLDSNFSSLTKDDIIEYLSQQNKLSSVSKNKNFSKNVQSSLKKNKIFKQKKSAIYELNLKECITYLKSYNNKDETDNLNSNDSSNENKNPVISPLINFSENENMKSFEDDRQNIIIEANNIDNSFTFGEQSQILISNKNIPYNSENNENEVEGNIIDTDLEAKVIEEYIPEFEYEFDSDKNFENLIQKFSQFFNIYKEQNKNQNNINKLSEDIKNLNELIEELNIKINQFNNLSSLYNGEKNELFNYNSVIHQQLNLMQLLVDNSFMPKELYNGEKEVLFTYNKHFKDLMKKLKEHYQNVQNIKPDINKDITKLKTFLNEIADYYELKLNNNYADYYNIIININNGKSSEFNININETERLFNSYIKENEVIFSRIESLSNQKNEIEKENLEK